MKILITAGPTREPIDAVRFISNHSSGRLGLALASASVAAGHATTLLIGQAVSAGDVHALSESGVIQERFDTVSQLQERLESHWPDHDVLIMAAAVADFRPSQIFAGKLHRGDQAITIELESTPDLVAMMAGKKRSDQVVVAFALEEPIGLEQRACEKLKRKGVDAIVANPLATMEGEWIAPLWLTTAGDLEKPGRMTKVDFANWLVQKIEQIRT